MNTAIYLFACGPQQIRRARRCVSSFRKGGFDGRVVCICHSWDLDLANTFSEGFKIPPEKDARFYGQLPYARLAKVNPWKWGHQYTEDYILCLEPDILLSGPWIDVQSHLMGKIYCEQRTQYGGSEISLNGAHIGTGVIAMPNNALSKKWVKEAIRLFRRDADAAYAASLKIGISNCMPAPFAGTYNSPGGPFKITHYHREDGKELMDKAAKEMGI